MFFLIFSSCYSWGQTPTLTTSYRKAQQDLFTLIQTNYFWIFHWIYFTFYDFLLTIYLFNYFTFYCSILSLISHLKFKSLQWSAFSFWTLSPSTSFLVVESVLKTVGIIEACVTYRLQAISMSFLFQPFKT